MLLLDEPCSALDPIATGKIEELIARAARPTTRSSSSPTTCSRRRACPTTPPSCTSGDLIEFGPTERALHEADRSATPRTTSPAASADPAPSPRQGQGHDRKAPFNPVRRRAQRHLHPRARDGRPGRVAGRAGRLRADASSAARPPRRCCARKSASTTMEIEIDRDLSAIIARRQPTARDLRLLIAISKTIANLERVGDEAARIARTVQRLINTGVSEPPAPAGRRSALSSPTWRSPSCARRSTPSRAWTRRRRWRCSSTTTRSTTNSTAWCAS